MFFFVLCTFDGLIFLHGRGFDPTERIDLYCGTGDRFQPEVQALPFSVVGGAVSVMVFFNAGSASGFLCHRCLSWKHTDA